MKFAWMKAHGSREFGIEPMCRTLGVSKAGYYAWLKRPPSRQEARRRDLAVKIRQAHVANRRIYGSPRIHRELIADGEKVCRHTVARIMRQEQIRSIIARPFVVHTTDSRHDHPVHENRLNRQFYAEKPNQKWCADITCIPTKQGMLYLAAVIDLFSRKIVGWSMSESMPVDLVADALKMALARRQPDGPLLHHSDRGAQYACGVYQVLLAKEGIICSMSRIGNCYDNAVMESFFGTLKKECVRPNGSYATLKEARRSIFDYIEMFYNRRRRHSSLGYLSPEEFEKAATEIKQKGLRRAPQTAKLSPLRKTPDHKLVGFFCGGEKEIDVESNGQAPSIAASTVRRRLVRQPKT